jgi:hypothetical protein
LLGLPFTSLTTGNDVAPHRRVDCHQAVILREQAAYCWTPSQGPAPGSAASGPCSRWPTSSRSG